MEPRSRQTDSSALQLSERLVQLRRRIHANPEYGFKEFNTAALIAKTMRDLGADVREGVAKTGVVAELGSGSPIVAIRADMDALPIQEKTGLDFSSQTPDMMHACGHDAHIVCALGAAEILSGESISGKIRFLFQPSEEQRDEQGQSGAVKMIEEGALDDVSSVIALHTRALPVGSIGVTTGPAMAANDTITITILGRAAHGAHPEDGIDAIAIAAQVITAIQQIVSRRIAPVSPAVVSVTTIQGGVKENIIADRVELGGTIRSTGGDARAFLINELEAALNVGRAMGATCTLKIKEGYAATTNDPGVTQAIREAASEVLGADRVLEMPFDTWAEDFGYMTAQVPGSMFWLGVVSDRVPAPVWHSPTFDVDEDSLLVGARVLAASARRLLRQDPD